MLQTRLIALALFTGGRDAHDVRRRCAQTSPRAFELSVPGCLADAERPKRSVRIDPLDRQPADGTTGVCTVRTGHFDVENGYTNTTTTGPGGGSSANYPQSLIRIGTADPHFDFELGPPSYETSSVGTPPIGGSSDVSLGAKYELGYSSNADWGVNGVITFPTGSHAFTAGNAQFTGNLNGAYTINSEFALAGTLSFNAFSALNAGGVPQSYFAFIPSLELTAALPGGPSQIIGRVRLLFGGRPELGRQEPRRLRLPARLRRPRAVRRRVRLFADARSTAKRSTMSEPASLS